MSKSTTYWAGTSGEAWSRILALSPALPISLTMSQLWFVHSVVLTVSNVSMAPIVHHARLQLSLIGMPLLPVLMNVLLDGMETKPQGLVNPAKSDVLTAQLATTASNALILHILLTKPALYATFVAQCVSPVSDQLQDTA